MIKTLRLLLEYNTYPIFLYNEHHEIIDNDNPPEFKDDQELTDAFMAISNLYDTFFIDNEKEFRYIGCQSEENRTKLKNLIDNAVELLKRKVNGKYIIQNDIDYNSEPF